MDSEPTPCAQRVTGGKLRLKTVLETTTDPPAAVQAFRQEHNLGPTCENLVEFACLVRNSRSEIYLSLLDTLVKNLERSIPTMSREKQDELLKRSFHFVHTGDVLSKIPVSLLRRRSDIPKDYLDAFTQSPTFAASLPKMPIEVQRQVWCTETGLPSFESHLGIHMEKYRATLGQQHITRARTFRVVVVPQDKWRAQSNPLGAVVGAIGNRDELLEAACRLLLKRYAEAPDAEQGSVWAAMLFDILLKFDLVERNLRPRLMEKRGRVARCLDTAVRTTGRLDGAALSELHKALLSQFPATATGAAAGLGAVATSSLAAPTARQQQQSLSPEALKRLLEEAWMKLSEFDAERVFAEPVTDAIAPGYSNVIKKPMDLATMQAKIGASAYSSLDALSSDVDLMLANCVRFNTKASYFGTYANSLGAKWKSEKVKLQRKAKPPPPMVVPPAKRLLSSSASSAAAGAAAAGAPSNSNADSQLLLPPQPASSISLEGDVTLMLLAQPAILNALHHTFVRLMEDSLSARTLPAKHPHVQTLSQLLQLSHGARKAALSKLSIKPPEPVILRLLLPFYQRFLGEVAFSSKEFPGGGRNKSEAAVAPLVEALLADATWGAFLEIPLLRRFLLVSCGHAFVRQQPSSSSSKSKTLGDAPRAAALLKVLTLHASTGRHHYHLANDRWFLDALIAAATPPGYAGRVPEVRSAVLALLEALVQRKGYLCVAHSCLINVLANWSNATMVGREAPWMNAEEVGAILRRVSLAGGQSSGADGDEVDELRPAKRPYQPSDAPPRRLSAELWQSSEFSAVKAEYAKLKAVLPGLDVESALGVVH